MMGMMLELYWDGNLPEGLSLEVLLQGARWRDLGRGGSVGHLHRGHSSQHGAHPLHSLEKEVTVHRTTCPGAWEARGVQSHGRTCTLTGPQSPH